MTRDPTNTETETLLLHAAREFFPGDSAQQTRWAATMIMGLWLQIVRERTDVTIGLAWYSDIQH